MSVHPVCDGWRVRPTGLGRGRKTVGERAGWVTIEVPARLRDSNFRPEIGRDYPLNLSISLSGGKETNKDSLSNGE